MSSWEYPSFNLLSLVKVEGGLISSCFLKQSKANPGNISLILGHLLASPTALESSLDLELSLDPWCIPRRMVHRHTLQDVVGSWEAGDTTPAHSSMSAHKDSTASSRSICTSFVSNSGML